MIIDLFNFFNKTGIVNQCGKNERALFLLINHFNINQTFNHSLEFHLKVLRKGG